MTLSQQIEQQLMLPERVEKVDRLLERRERILERRIANAETEKDQERIVRLQGRIDRAERIRDELTGQLNSDQLAPLKDEFNIRTEVSDGIGWFYVTITNSPYDSTYVPNDPLVLSYSGCQKNPVGASSRCSRRSGSLANGDYWSEGLTGTQELRQGSSGFASILEDYDLSFLGIGRNKNYPSFAGPNIAWIYNEI